MSGLERLGLYGLCEIPGKEFIDAADWMVGDLGQHGAEIELRIVAIQLRPRNSGKSAQIRGYPPPSARNPIILEDCALLAVPGGPLRMLSR